MGDDFDRLKAELMQDRRFRFRYRLVCIRWWLAFRLHRLGWWLEGADLWDWRCPHCHKLLGPESEEEE